MSFSSRLEAVKIRLNNITFEHLFELEFFFMKNLMFPFPFHWNSKEKSLSSTTVYRIRYAPWILFTFIFCPTVTAVGLKSLSIELFVTQKTVSVWDVALCLIYLQTVVITVGLALIDLKHAEETSGCFAEIDTIRKHLIKGP